MAILLIEIIRNLITEINFVMTINPRFAKLSKFQTKAEKLSEKFRLFKYIAFSLPNAF